LDFIRDSAYVFDAIVIVLGAIGVIGGVTQLSFGRLPYPAILARLRRQLPATAEDVKLEGLVVVLLACATVVLGFGLLMWHLLLGQRPDQTLEVVYGIATVTVSITGVALVLTARIVGKKRQYLRRQLNGERRTT
jgi:hypothetical protein